MKDVINLTNSPRTQISFIDEDLASKNLRDYEKKWSFSNIYYLTELRDIYLALNKFEFDTFPRNFKKEFTKFCLSIDLPFVKTPWEERRVLEYLNALKNFSLVNDKYEIITEKKVFIESKIAEPLSQSDIATLKEIYFTYFRFKEFFSWFINPPAKQDLDFVMNIKPQNIYKNSKPIYFFSNKSRFTENFIYELEDNTPIYYIDKSDGKLARFWDVFTSWGKNLNILEKFNFKYPPIRPSLNLSRTIGCSYIINERFPKIDLLDYLDSNFKRSHIYLPYLVLDIALKYKLKIEDVQKFILEQYKQYKEFFSFERTSEIFIKKGKIKAEDKILFPKHRGTYISHLIIRK